MFKLALATLAIAVQASDVLQFQRDGHPQCGDIHDCFNCTLHNCHWGGHSCDHTSEAGNPLLVSQFFDKGKTCGDPLGLCKLKVKYKNGKEDETKLSWDHPDEKTLLPKGYFCIHHFNNDHENWNWQMDVDHSGRIKNGVESELVTIFERNVRSEKRKHRPRRYITTYVYESEAYIEDTNATYGGVFPIGTGTKEFSVGYVNQFTRTIDDADDFDIELKKVSGWTAFKLFFKTFWYLFVCGCICCVGCCIFMALNGGHSDEGSHHEPLIHEEEHHSFSGSHHSGSGSHHS